jgi:hypothetical protein
VTKSQSRALKCALFFRSIGLCPLPSRGSVKAPSFAEYEQYWSEPVPESVFDEQAWWSWNLQVMTGAKTPGDLKIVVVDCDGIEAPSKWRDMQFIAGDPREPTWTVETGSGGLHTYYRLPTGMAECKTGRLWSVWDSVARQGKGDWAKHKEVRLMADSGLIVAPPSCHVTTGRRYRFLPSLSPNEIKLPAIAPDWLLAMPRLANPNSYQPVYGCEHVIKSPIRLPVGSWRNQEVLEAIDDKASLARSWGVSAPSWAPNSRGWIKCWVPGRENPQTSNSPSGGLSVSSGRIQDYGDGTRHTLFDVGVLTGVFATWQDCRQWCGDKFVKSSISAWDGKWPDART